MSAAASASPRTGWASLRDLTGYQWFVFIVCCLAWDMDCLDQQLFTLARRPAMLELVGKVEGSDPRVPEHTRKLSEQSEKDGKPAPNEEVVLESLRNSDVSSAAGYATSIFLIGWAIGGIAFGIMVPK